MKIQPILDKNYLEFLHLIKSRIISARISAARYVNSELILLYWDIGRGIVEKQKELGWGESVVEALSRDLRRLFPDMKGFSIDNLWRMRKLYNTYSSIGFLAQLVPEINSRHMTSIKDDQIPAQAVPELLTSIPWGHHVVILNKVRSHEAALYYIRSTSRFGWTRNVLLNQIKAKAYERALREKKAHNFPAVLPERLGEQADEALKRSYNLEFLGIRHEVFEREYAGKMDFYLNLLNEREKSADDNPSIGIILCAEKYDMVVEFSLKIKMNPIGVAEYQLTKKLPRELKGKLPSERELRTALLSGTGKR